MKLNHLALPASDILAEQDFYCRYFGFRPNRGPGFLVNDEGFVLVLDPVASRPHLPEGLHFGFHPGSHAEVRALYHQMREDGVNITVPLSETNSMMTFSCSDPEGYTVEVRAIQ